MSGEVQTTNRTDFRRKDSIFSPPARAGVRRQFLARAAWDPTRSRVLRFLGRVEIGSRIRSSQQEKKEPREHVLENAHPQAREFRRPAGGGEEKKNKRAPPANGGEPARRDPGH